MCANYTPSPKDVIAAHFGVQLGLFDFPLETFPGYMAPIVRRVRGTDADVECVLACFGMVPHWADLKLARSTYNARSETVAQKPSFREAWKRRQFCIIPARALFEPRYATEQPVRWRIERADGGPLGIAGIWETKPDGPDGQPLISFSMLTINADEHGLMRQFHQPDDEKRMVVILEPWQYAGWLRGDLAGSTAVFRTYPAELLSACADPLPLKSRPARPDWRLESGRQGVDGPSGKPAAPGQGELF